MKNSSYLLQLENTHAKKRRPSATKNKQIFKIQSFKKKNKIGQTTSTSG